MTGRDPSEQRYLRTIAVVSLAAAAIRVFLLWRPPLWRDEAFTASAVSGRGFGAMLDTVRHDSAPPLDYVLVHVVAQLSNSAYALRLVSVIAGVVAVPIAAALGRRSC